MQVASAKDKDPVVFDMTFYGVIEEIWELEYENFCVPVFKCIWADNNSGVKTDDLGFTLSSKKKNYIKDPTDHAWSVVLETPTREYFEYTNGGELEETAVMHQCFTTGLHAIDPNMTDEDEPPCFRKDCDGIWIDNVDA
ncbi:hypothetical protein ACS0TY_018977 [Phlomoides rotata]